MVKLRGRNHKMGGGGGGGLLVLWYKNNLSFPLSLIKDKSLFKKKTNNDEKDTTTTGTGQHFWTNKNSLDSLF